MLITKRDGSLQEFDRNKILKSILACFEACGETCGEVETVVHAIDICIMTMDTAKQPITVSGIQDCTERTLIEHSYHEAAACFMAYRIEKDFTRARRLTPDPLAIQEYIHMAKYSRWLPDAKRREDFHENVDRVIEMHYQKFDRTVHDEITSAFRYVYTKAVLPSMRSMQFAGPAIAKNNARMYNCCFTHIDRAAAFSETLFLLLSGCGVGFSVQWEHVDMLPSIGSVGRTVIHHTIADSIEGWSDALGALITSYMEPGKWMFGDNQITANYIEFDYSEIRAEGTPLKTSGGKAPGHLGLKAMLEEVRSVLDGAVGRKLRPIEAHDMMCYIARAVLSGGIRRSSMVSLFSPSDTEMMYAKAIGVFDPIKGINDQRQMANNAAALVRATTSHDVFKRIFELSSSGFGDPGFVFVEGVDWGINPCAEIVLNPTIEGEPVAGFAFCNLTTINASTCPSLEEFLKRCDAASVIGTLQACFSEFSYLHPRSRAIAERDRLIGVSITGIMDNPAVLDWLVEGRVAVDQANSRVASLLGINTSARCCCIKPEGTASLMLGTSSGVHCHHSRRYLRRVTVNRTEVIGRAFASINPHMIEEKPNGDYVIVFPIQARDDAIIDMPGISFVKTVSRIIKDWCGVDGHNISCTVPVREGDGFEVFDYIWNNRESLSSLSFAPVDLSTRYPFAPLERVEGRVLEAYWDQLIRNYKPVNWLTLKESEDNTDPSSVAACDGGACEKASY